MQFVEGGFSQIADRAVGGDVYKIRRHILEQKHRRDTDGEQYYIIGYFGKIHVVFGYYAVDGFSYYDGGEQGGHHLHDGAYKRGYNKRYVRTDVRQ